ncbi:colicin-like pore-forming protein [Enterobacter cloacae]|jgi:hypothetical protein|nr:colicin-like pore-forming protein [Enterobacter cloacae]MCD1391321.1 hypothetical protein [Enterobacter cloacae]MDS0063493.1 colicin-like pore-forming protein [Enterobacter cloacae subsp. cloacae]MDS0103290.1 colicin-like pore-forming protein [Enterobacter cloacae subsp. cloacae]MDV5404355.1 colicin-like pore-forming protein [Enterobacter cloacae]MDW8494440.1 colicin-like pore-forming protein [Enterobacter cloacae subsp. cloacae]
MAWTGFGGGWSNGVHSGGDDSGSIGGGGIQLDGKGNPVNTRAPNANDIVSQFNSYGGTQITSSQVSNIRSDGYGGYAADIAGQTHTVSSETGSETSNTVSGFTGVSTSSNGNANGWNNVTYQIQQGRIPSDFSLKHGKVGIIVDEKFIEIPSLTSAYNQGKAQRKSADEKKVLEKTSEIIVGSGEKISHKLNVHFATISKELADEIKRFQGKKIRKSADAMKTINKIINDPNPRMKLSNADKASVIKALKSFNLNTFASNFKNLGTSFKVADIVMKGQTIIDKTIIGFETGNWSPLMLEIETMAIGSVFSSATIGIVGAIITAYLAPSSLLASALTIAAVIAFSILASYIDTSLIEKINTYLVPRTGTKIPSKLPANDISRHLNSK